MRKVAATIRHQGVVRSSIWSRLTLSSVMVGDLAGFRLGQAGLLVYHRDVSFLLALIVPLHARPGLGKKGHRPGPRYRPGPP
jgi:hypothetical protein